MAAASSSSSPGGGGIARAMAAKRRRADSGKPTGSGLYVDGKQHEWDAFDDVVMSYGVVVNTKTCAAFVDDEPRVLSAGDHVEVAFLRTAESKAELANAKIVSFRREDKAIKVVINWIYDLKDVQSLNHDLGEELEELTKDEIAVYVTSNHADEVDLDDIKAMSNAAKVIPKFDLNVETGKFTRIGEGALLTDTRDEKGEEAFRAFCTADPEFRWETQFGQQLREYLYQECDKVASKHRYEIEKAGFRSVARDAKTFEPLPHPFPRALVDSLLERGTAVKFSTARSTVYQLCCICQRASSLEAEVGGHTQDGEGHRLDRHCFDVFMRIQQIAVAVERERETWRRAKGQVSDMFLRDAIQRIDLLKRKTVPQRRKRLPAAAAAAAAASASASDGDEVTSD